MSTEMLHVNKGMVGERFTFEKHPETLPVCFDDHVGLEVTFRDQMFARVFFADCTTKLNGQGHGGIAAVEVVAWPADRPANHVGG